MHTSEKLYISVQLKTLHESQDFVYFVSKLHYVPNEHAFPQLLFGKFRKESFVSPALRRHGADKLPAQRERARVGVELEWLFVNPRYMCTKKKMLSGRKKHETHLNQFHMCAGTWGNQLQGLLKMDPGHVSGGTFLTAPLTSCAV